MTNLKFIQKHTGNLLLLLLVFCFDTRLTSQTFVEQNGQLSVKGTVIVNKDGDTVQLKGMSFFWSQWIGKYYTYNTVKWLRDDWKCTVVRAAMAVEAGGYLTSPKAEKQKIYTVVDAAIDLGIYVIVDWHDHNAQRHRVAAQNFFAELAKKYGNSPNIIYEPYNEPLAVSWKDSIKPYHEAVIDSIRAYDPDNIVICGTKTWSQDVDEASLNMIKDTNIVYTLHYYAATHKQSYRDKAANAIKKGAALFVTEYGTCTSSGSGFLDTTETKRWWKFLDDNKIGYCNWSVSDKTETASVLKPNASVNGGWDTSWLSPSGKFVRDNLLGLTYFPPPVIKPIDTTSYIFGIQNTGSYIFPNPANNRINVKLEFNSDCSAKIYDLTGRAVMNLNKIKNNAEIDISGLVPGMYFIGLEGIYKKEVYNFIKR
jgi:endoglucanase